ncbi:hypothetical protein ACWPKO_10640 [Coraliomargarita sp. W4R53]
MEDHELDQLIGVLKNRTQPACSASLESNVLRRLRLEEPDSENGLSDWLALLLGRSGFVATMLAVAVVTSASVTVAASSANAVGLDRQAESARALDFGSITNPNLLSFEAGR